MADTKLTFKVVAPSREIVSVSVDEVTLPGEKGYFGVLPGHTPFLTRLGTGEATYRIGDKKVALALSGGIAEVNDDVVIVLARVAEKADEIDVERARKAKERAEQRLQGKSSDVDFIRAEAALQRAVTRLKVAEQKAH